MAEETAFGIGGVIGLIVWLGIAIASFAFYFLPTVIAYVQKHSALTGIFLVNLIFGCTFIGWLAAFIWSFIDNKTTVIVQNAAPATVPRCLSCGSFDVAMSPSGLRRCMSCGNQG